MTFSPPHATTEKDKARDTKKAKKVTADAKAKTQKPGFFALEWVDIDVLDDEVERPKTFKLVRVIQTQVVTIVMLTFVLLAGTPFFQTIFQYYAIDPSRHIVRLVPLAKPNMTNQAVLSWAANSITEIMTFGFGDYRHHLRDQEIRFTPEGWASFVKAFDKMEVGVVFRERQLVLTTVPSDQPVITKQGDKNPEHNYEWEVQMPIIMTYATNNNVTRKDAAMVTLTIARVPTSYTAGGVAIKRWMQ